MPNLINIAFQGGTHGSYLQFCIDKFSKKTKDLQGLPFTRNKTSHAKLEYSGLVMSYHPTFDGYKNKDEPHILITMEEKDLLFIERWVTIRAGDFGVDTSKDLVKVTTEFLKRFSWDKKFKQYYNLDLLKSNYTIPKFILRDSYKMSFLDPSKNGFIVNDKMLRTNMPKNTYLFPVSSFWDKNSFYESLKKLDEFFDLKLVISDTTIHDKFLQGLHFIETKNRGEEVITAIKNLQDIDITNLDTVEQAYVSAWIEKNNRFITIPVSNQFFRTTGEILQWLENYPEHYKAMNPNLPTFNNIPNPYHLWNSKK